MPAYLPACLPAWLQKSSSRWWYTDDDDTPNHKLQQAIIVYLNTLPNLFSQLECCNVQLCKGKRKQHDAHSTTDDGDTDGCSSSTSSDIDWYQGDQPLWLIVLPQWSPLWCSDVLRECQWHGVMHGA